MAEITSLEAIRNLIGQGRHQEASEACRRLIDAGDDPEARYLLAVIMGQTGLFGEAIQLFEKAVQEFPGRADVAYNFGIILQTMGKLDDAMAQWSRAIECDPRHADAHFNLGRAYSEKKMWAEALVACEAAAALRPENTDALYNLGNVNFRLRRMAHAKYCFDQVVTHDPGHVQGWINLGLAELRRGEAEAACRALEKSVALDPENVLARFNLGQALLAAGRWEEGFAEAEWRRRVHELPFAVAGQPPWQGEDIAGKGILLYAEQGFGDVIQYLRYAQAVADRGATVGVCCHPSLVGIAGATQGVEKATPFAAPPAPFDTYAPLMSLPHILGLTAAADIPGAPYVRAPEAAELAGGNGGVRVGLVWAGTRELEGDVTRSVGLDDLRPLFDLAGVNFFSLQVGGSVVEIERLGLADTVADLGSGFADFSDTAAVLEALDLVVSIDTAVAHLAGALGRPVWTLLAHVADWRWGRPGDEPPWYPSMRFFRQSEDADWAPVIQRLAAELGAFAGNPG